MLWLGAFGDALLSGFVVVGVFCFFPSQGDMYGMHPCILVYIWTHLDSKAYICIIIGDEHVSKRLLLFLRGIWDYVLFLKHSAFEVKVCAFYGATWREQEMTWVELSRGVTVGMPRRS